MAVEQRLSDVLSEFARNLGTDFPIQAILDHLVERVVEILPVTGAGVTLMSDDLEPHYVAASDAAALAFEQVQSRLEDGPCRLAVVTGQAVASPDLRGDTRFGAFAAEAVPAGLVAAFSFPLRHNDQRLGALDLYRGTPGGLNRRDLAAAQTLADVAAAYLLNAQARGEASEASLRLRELSLHDPLTGLPNRVLLQEHLEHAIARARRSHATTAVLFADLDRFKQVNDTYGHAIGDELLVAVANRLRALLRPGDTLARVSGDEFVILCEDLDVAAHVEQLSARIRQALTAPFALGAAEIVISASVGIAFAGPGEQMSAQLLRDADAAMYQAKRLGGARHQVVDVGAYQAYGGSEAMEAELRAAVAQRRLDVHYQPVVSTVDGAIQGAEALLRWWRPGVGAVSPDTVVPLAERTGLISTLGRQVLEQACRDRAGWAAVSPGPLQLCVNVSARQVLRPGFCHEVAEVLAVTALPAEQLTLEVTESVFLGDADLALGALHELKGLGVKLALDDFGTGYSSLSYLRRFPADLLKIDASFVADLGSASPGATIAAAVVDLAHRLGLGVVAEGVETAAQRKAVLELGCEQAQGFYFSSALPADRLRDRLAAGALLP